MSFDDWLLALHVIGAFAYVAGVVLFWILVVAVRKVDTPEGTIRMEPMAFPTSLPAFMRAARTSMAAAC